jgi:nucleotide-binding universal stress UspA family protein
VFSKLVVALDGSVESERILPLASTIARITGGELNIVRVIDDDAESAELDAAIRQLASLSAEMGSVGLPLHTNVVRGDVVGQLLREIDRVNADAVLMTTHGRGGLKRALMGSVTEKMLEHSNVPVIALRSGGKAVDTIHTVVVPIDDSLGSALALSAAKLLAGPASAHIELLHVVPPLVRYLRGRYIHPEWEEETRARAEANMELLASSLRHIGFDAHGRAVIGQVAPSIVATANEVRADLIVMTTSGYTGPVRAILGSVADEVLRTAEVPVLLLHFNLEDGLMALRESASGAVATTTAAAQRQEG